MPLFRIAEDQCVKSLSIQTNDKACKCVVVASTLFVYAQTSATKAKYESISHAAAKSIQAD
eukprot:4828874-Amphidinium_carterae.1